MNFFQKALKFVGISRYESGRDSHKSIGCAWQELSAIRLRAIVSACRDQYANNGFVRDIVAANDIYSVGDGITPEPATADVDWNERAAEYFERWSGNVSSDGGLTLAEATSMASQRLDIDGEFYTLKHDVSGSPRLSFLETQDLDMDYSATDANIVQGIEFCADGSPRTYWFKTPNGRHPIDANFIVHTFVRESFSSVHGLPQIQHAINSIKDTKDILRAVIANAKVQHAVSMILKSERAAALGTGELFDRINSNPEYLSRVANLIDAEDLEAFQTTSPNESVLNALNILDRRSCGGVLPPDFFDPSKIGGASTRLITSKAARHFGRRQTQLINHFLKPIWNFVIARAMLSGDLPENKDFQNIEWNCPKSITVDAGREEATDMKLVECGLKSETTYFAERGMNARKEMRRAVKDKEARQAAMKAAGLELRV